MTYVCVFFNIRFVSDMKLKFYKKNETYSPVAYLTLLFIFFYIIGVSLRINIFNPPIVASDESYYLNEVEYLSKYGLFNALSQGTSVIYSCLIFLFSKIFFIKFIVGARLLSLVSYLVSCKLLLCCFHEFSGIHDVEKYFVLSSFSFISGYLLFMGLPDLTETAFALIGLYFIAKNANQGQKNSHFKIIAISAVFFFLSFASKPVILLAIPGVILFIFFKNLTNATAMHNTLNSLTFICVFLALFIVYHIPGYLTYHKLMLEEKMHVYEFGKRVDIQPSTREFDIYYEIVKNNHQNIWTLTHDEVAEFKKKHPEVNLTLSLPQYISHYFGHWLTNGLSKIFIFLPYHIQGGFFFAKWTVINRWVRNSDIIRMITLLIIYGMYFLERKFVKENLLLLFVPFLYVVFLAFYAINEYESNWIVFALPFLSLPIVKVLCKYINIYVLFGLQFAFLFYSAIG